MVGRHTKKCPFPKLILDPDGIRFPSGIINKLIFSKCTRSPWIISYGTNMMYEHNRLKSGDTYMRQWTGSSLNRTKMWLCQGSFWVWAQQMRHNLQRNAVSHWLRPYQVWYLLCSGLGRVPDLRVRVQVRVLVICVSPSPSPSPWLLHEYEYEYEYEYWLMSTSTSTSIGLWSTFYIACIGSRFLLFGLWQESPQILTNLGQSSNCPLSM